MGINTRENFYSSLKGLIKSKMFVKINVTKPYNITKMEKIKNGTFFGVYKLTE